jgi:hypothetical protein
MPLPVPVIMGALQMMQAAASHQATSMQARVNIERLRYDAQRYEAQLAFEERQSELKLQLLHRMIDAAENIFNTKIESINELCRNAQKQLHEHMEILRCEQSALAKIPLEQDVSAEREAKIRSRQRDINLSLQELADRDRELVQMHAAVVIALRPEISLPEAKLMLGGH